MFLSRAKSLRLVAESAVLLLSSNSFALERVSKVSIDLNKVHAVYVHPGLVSVLEFPKPITEVRVGDPKSLKVIISQVSPKEITIYLSSSSSKPTNLIVRAEKNIYVMDVVPNRTSHQDFVRIANGVGAVRNRVESRRDGTEVTGTMSTVKKTKKPSLLVIPIGPE